MKAAFLLVYFFTFISRAEWKAQSFNDERSDRRIAFAEAIDRSPALPSILFLERGNRDSGAITYVRLGGQDGVTGSRTKTASRSSIFRLDLDTKETPRLGQQFAVEFHRSLVTTLLNDGIQAGTLECGKTKWLIGEFDNGSIAAINLSSDEILNLTSGNGRPSGHKHEPVILNKSSLLISDASQNVSLLVECVAGAVKSYPVTDSNGKNVYSVGSGSINGNRVVLAVAKQPNALIVGEIDKVGRFRAISTTVLGAFNTIGRAIIAEGRGDGVRRIYVGAPRGLAELTPAGSGYEISYVDGESRSGAFAGATTGLLFGAFRDDQTERLYVANASSFIEYAFRGGQWRRNESKPLNQSIYGLLPMPWIGKTKRLAIIGENYGLWQMKWFPEGIVVVAPFEGKDGEAISEFVRYHLLSLGDCPVLERERMSALLAERDLQAARFTDAAGARRLGKLLGADYVIVGRSEHFLGGVLVSGKSVEVATGIISRQQFLESTNLPDLRRVLPEFSFGVCSAERK